jgi:hypothetical protein
LGGVNIWIPAVIGVIAIGIFWWAALTLLEIKETSHKAIFWLWVTMTTAGVIWFMQTQAIDATYDRLSELGVYETTVVVMLNMPYLVAFTTLIFGMFLSFSDR